MARAIAFLAALLVLAGGCHRPEATPKRHEVAAICTPGPIAAALRNDGAGWYAIADADHAPLNVASVETNGSAIVVRFTGKRSVVRTFIASPDESLARKGYAMGSRVGLDKAEIVLTKGGLFGVRSVDPREVSTKTVPWSNIWIYGVVEGACEK